MAEFFLGQIMMTGFGFAQKQFAQCNGQILPIAQNQALFSLLGIAYGGNGQTNFALPDMRSRTPAGGLASADPDWQPQPYPLGQPAGTETVTLSMTELPSHTHMITATSATATLASPGRTQGLTLANTSPDSLPFYSPATNPVAISGGPLTDTGGNQPHTNMQPSSTINFNIALAGIFPSRN